MYGVALINTVIANWTFFIYKYKSSRVFENQPNKICSHLSEKALKDRFFKPEKFQNHCNEGKGKESKSEEKERRRREKSNGCTLSFYIS